MFEFTANHVEALRVVSATEPCLKDFKLADLRGVVINYSAAKNDSEGEGYRFHYTRQDKSQNAAFDLVEILVKWALLANLKPNDPFLSYWRKWKLSYLCFNQL